MAWVGVGLGTRLGGVGPGQLAGRRADQCHARPRSAVAQCHLDARALFTWRAVVCLQPCMQDMRYRRLHLASGGQKQGRKAGVALPLLVG